MRTVLKVRRRLAGELVPFEADAIAWLDAFSLLDDGLANGDPVETWTSRINPATGSAGQATLAARPILSTDVDATGTPGLVFDGNDDFMTLGDAWKQAPAGPWTQYIVVRRSSTATKAIMGWSAGTTGSYVYNFVSTTGHNWTVGGTFSGNITSPSFANGTRQIATVTNVSGAGYSVHLDNVQAFSTGSNGTTTSATQPLLGARWATGGLAQELWMQGTIQSVLTYGVAHDATQRAAVVAFLEARYAV